MNRISMPTPPSLAQIALRSLGRSFLASIVLSAAFAIAQAVSMSMNGAGIDSLTVVSRAATSFVVCWPAMFAVFLVMMARSLADRAFTAAGFLATFLGFGILTVFFVRLGHEVWLYYQISPALIREANEQTKAKLIVLGDREKAQAALEAELKKAEAERDADVAAAKTEQEKEELRTLYEEAIATKRKDIEKNATEFRSVGAGTIREDVSPGALTFHFLTSGPSSEPFDAGIYPALMGSLWLGLVTIVFAVPVGVAAALYLEEYRSESWLAKVIQVNINNLAGIPSVVFGILGGFVFVYAFKILNTKYGVPIDHRALLGGGLTLGLLTLPVIIVSSQEAIRAVPISLRQGAYALGATKWQVMWHIVLPMARPGIMTGVILAVSRAIGEAAPLVLFGAKMYVDQTPTLFDRFTALPLQIFNWCDRPEEIWKYNAALASMVLLIMLITLNATAIVLRNRAQRKLRV